MPAPAGSRLHCALPVVVGAGRESGEAWTTYCKQSKQQVPEATPSSSSSPPPAYRLLLLPIATPLSGRFHKFLNRAFYSAKNLLSYAHKGR